MIDHWRQYLHRDPTRWLLANGAAPFSPSILLWYQLDLARRPEESQIVQATREHVLYSTPVQTLFNAQDALGFWASPDSLAAPHWRATLWNLALLAELGIPRASRHARAASEFALQNFLDAHGRFEGLSAPEAGYLVRALGYFNLAADERVRRAARALVAWSRSEDSAAAHLCALWAWRDFLDDDVIASASRALMERLLTILPTFSAFSPITFPPFDPHDALFILRVLAEYDRVHDSRAAFLLEHLIAKQDEQGRWALERSLNDRLLTPLEDAGAPSRLATLNALRVISKRVTAQTTAAGAGSTVS